MPTSYRLTGPPSPGRSVRLPPVTSSPSLGTASRWRRSSPRTPPEYLEALEDAADVIAARRAPAEDAAPIPAERVWANSG